MPPFFSSAAYSLRLGRHSPEELRAASYEVAKAEFAEVSAFAVAAGAEEAKPQSGGLRQWDVSFWAERQREAKYEFTEEELRPYCARSARTYHPHILFPNPPLPPPFSLPVALPAVLDGLFALISRLFGVVVSPADGEAPVWHKDVRFFKIAPSAGGKPVAYFYLDPFSRPETKRGGAWMDDVTGRSRGLAPPGQAVRLPVAHMVCNSTPPVGGALRGHAGHTLKPY